MLYRLLAAALLAALAACIWRVWVHLPPERTPADYARDVLEAERERENDRERV